MNSNELTEIRNKIENLEKNQEKIIDAIQKVNLNLIKINPNLGKIWTDMYKGAFKGHPY